MAFSENNKCFTDISGGSSTSKEETIQDCIFHDKSRTTKRLFKAVKPIFFRKENIPLTKFSFAAVKTATNKRPIH